MEVEVEVEVEGCYFALWLYKDRLMRSASSQRASKFFCKKESGRGTKREKGEKREKRKTRTVCSERTASFALIPVFTCFVLFRSEISFPFQQQKKEETKKRIKEKKKKKKKENTQDEKQQEEETIHLYQPPSQ